MAGFGSHHVARHAIYARAPSEIRQLVLDHLSPPPCPPRPWRSRSYAHAQLARKLLPQPEPEVDGIDEDELGDGVQRQQSTTKRFTKRRTLSSLQPLVFTPIFPKNLLPPPETDIELKDQGPPHGAEPSTSRVHSTSLSLANLPPNTTKALLRPRFIKYGKIENIWVDEEGRTATITFVDARSVTTVLKENASRPLMMKGQELILWRKVSVSAPTPVPIPPISSQQSPQPPSSTTGSSSPSLRPSPQASSSSNQDFDQDDFSMFPDEELDTNRTNFQRNDHDRGRGVLYVRNLHRWTTLRELRETFIAYGTIVAIRHKEQSNHAHILFHQKHHIYRTLELTKNNPLVLRDRRLILEASPDVPDILELERDTLWHTSLDDPFVGSSSPSPYRVLAIRAASEAAKAIRNQVQSPPSCTLFAGKLPIGVRPAKLARLFTRLGPLVDLRIAAHRRYALLEYPTVDAAVFALQEAINAQVRYGHMLPELDFASDNRTSRRSRTIYVNNWPAIDGEHRVPNKEEQKEVASGWRRRTSW
ncbi:hypothetical protein OF83DRAFT_480451 [Amylostereum chailletii]|nr:hypothetical protein OF83DRAFT_480451 [Amylostereum chailletii]